MKIFLRVLKSNNKCMTVQSRKAPCKSEKAYSSIIFVQAMQMGNVFLLLQVRKILRQTACGGEVLKKGARVYFEG